jgi:hypothetical protein
VAAGLLVLHHRGPDLERVQIGVRRIQQGVGLRFQQPGQEPVAQQPAGGIAAVGIEAEAHHRLAVADHVGLHGHHGAGHLPEIDVGVGNG